MHFIPGKRQRKIAALREHAAIEGLFVEFRTVPGSDKRRAWGLPPIEGNVIYYGKRLPRRKGRQALRGSLPEKLSWVRSADGWRAVHQSRSVPDVLSQLAPEILAASWDEASCGIYWQERGDTAEVDEIHAILEQWSKILRE